MKNRVIRYAALCLLGLLLVVGCQSTTNASIPVTGADEIPIPARVEMVRGALLAYVSSSARLENIPPDTDWQLDTTQRREGQYRFKSGDWFMVIRLANAREENERIIISNPRINADWCGYVRPDGHIVDTSYMP